MSIYSKTAKRKEEQMKINSNVLEILNNSRLKDNVLYLPPQQLERKLYVEVNKVLEILGGKWDRKIRGHKFDEDVEELLNKAINYGEIIDHKKELQYFPTPLNIVKQLIELAEIEPNNWVLEPSAGEGAILKELRKFAERSYYVEINEKFWSKLDEITPYALRGDFLEKQPIDLMDRVVMNPPFSKQQDIDHILHAYSYLKPGAILVSIVSESPFFRINNKSIQFREWLDKNDAEIIELEPGAFKESGTMVKTRIIKIRKPHLKRKP